MRCQSICSYELTMTNLILHHLLRLFFQTYNRNSPDHLSITLNFVTLFFCYIKASMCLLLLTMSKLSFDNRTTIHHQISKHLILWIGRWAAATYAVHSFQSSVIEFVRIFCCILSKMSHRDWTFLCDLLHMEILFEKMKLYCKYYEFRLVRCWEKRHLQVHTPCNSTRTQ